LVTKQPREEKQTLQLTEKIRIHNADDNKFHTNKYSQVFNSHGSTRYTGLTASVVTDKSVGLP